MVTTRSRIARKKIRGKKRKRRVFSLLFLLILFTAGYTIFEYNEGYHNAAGSLGMDEGNLISPGSKNVADEFEGIEDKLGKINILLLGVDAAKSTKARTDTIMIAQYDPKQGTAKLASIMRDTYVTIPGYSSNKINAAFYHGGAELLRKTIKENFGIDVEYYALVNFDGFTEVIDVLSPDGVEIDVEKRMKYTDRAGGLYIDLQKGIQKLNGEELLQYARFRNDAEGDFGRVRRQQQVIQAVKDEVVSVTTVAKLPRILGTIQPFIDTNLSPANVLAIGSKFLLNPTSKIETLQIPVEGSFSLSRNHAGSVIIFDKDKNKEAIDQFFNSSQTDSSVTLKDKQDKQS